MSLQPKTIEEFPTIGIFSTLSLVICYYSKEENMKKFQLRKSLAGGPANIYVSVFTKY